MLNEVIIPLRYVRELKLSLNEAICLAYLQVKKEDADPKDIEEKDWWPMPSTVLQAELNITARQERLIMENLVKKGIVERKMMGRLPAVRHLRIDQDAVAPKKRIRVRRR